MNNAQASTGEFSLSPVCVPEPLSKAKPVRGASSLFEQQYGAAGGMVCRRHRILARTTTGSVAAGGGMHLLVQHLHFTLPCLEDNIYLPRASWDGHLSTHIGWDISDCIHVTIDLESYRCIISARVLHPQGLDYSAFPSSPDSSFVGFMEIYIV
jgi:hypothetical protein